MRTPFHEIRGRLDALGKPRFRLSCREADWLGENDRKHLESVSPDSSVSVLRLDSLTDADINSILDARPDIPDPAAFIKAAKERRVEGLLPNPQTLEMLADVVGAGDGWPESRMQTFEMACRQMVREHNEEHQAAQESGSPPSLEQLLDAAGRLCAVQLISGVAGYTLRGQPDEDYPAPDQRDYDSPEALRSALFTKLFRAASNSRFTPVHRHVAEFLCAGHLAQLIEGGLPARRIIALMAGGDGSVVTEMRGLSAWLAAHSPEARMDLIERDPVGVGLYGDIGAFHLDEKRALLKSLKREGARLGSLSRTVAAFGALATREMEPVFKQILTDPSRERGHQEFVRFLLLVLMESGSLPGLAQPLSAIAHDDSWSPPLVNRSSLHAFIHHCPEGPEKIDRLKMLLEDTRAERVSDPERELLGALLSQLYPKDLPPAEVWNYLSEKENPELLGGDHHFWDERVAFVEMGRAFGPGIMNSSDEQVAELLDHLNERFCALQPILESRHLGDLPVRLLARGLKAHGERLDSHRLYDWLSLGRPWDQDISGREAVQEIRSWVEERPAVQREVVREGLARSSGSGHVECHALEVKKRLYGANLPHDVGSGTLPRQFKEGGKVEEQNRQEQQWLEQVRANKTELHQNRAAPSLLYAIAKEYFANIRNSSGLGGQKAIRKQLGDNPELAGSALNGLCGTLDREDVPDFEEILRLRLEGKIHYLGLPFLAGLAELERTLPEDVCHLDEARTRKALAFYFIFSRGDYRPQWYKRLLETRPQIVSEVQVRCAICELRTGRVGISRLRELAYDPGHAQVAKHASLPLLDAFPTRCKLKQLGDLDHLLWAAIKYADGAPLQELIKKKCCLKSMNDMQRVHWLAAGVILSQGTYEERLKDHIKSRERPIWHLVQFYGGACNPDPVVDRHFLGYLRTSVLELLIRMIGSLSTLGWEAISTPDIQATGLVQDMIQRLSASPSRDASDALARLVAAQELSCWRNRLSRAQDAQRVIRRDATYRHPDIAQVCLTLNGGTPANAADLAALVMDLLQKLGDQILRSDADDWSKYWNVDSYGRPVDPRHESTCRNTLLSDLRKLLPERVSAGREGQHRNDKRDDIWVSCLDCRVPVEVKRNANRRVWSALRNQLIAQYTSTLGCDGYGIYLVFWFGRKGTPPPPTGVPPATAEELQQRLQATLTPDEARKISICVVDVSRPDG